MTLEGIKELIERLQPEEQTVLAWWMSERDAQAWDVQIAQDFSPGGAGMAILEEVDSRIEAGNLEPFKAIHPRE